MALKATKANLDMSGTRLGSHTLVRLLGKGGLGTVYLARNDIDRSMEAVKILDPKLIGSARTLERFQREIENSKILSHPNIVKVTGSGNSLDIFYLTMEYCRGGSLNELASGQGPLPPGNACSIVVQVLDGLEYAHNVEVPMVKMSDGTYGKGFGLIHRDIKPENILLSDKMQTTNGRGQNGNETENRRNGESVAYELTVKVSDFGLAKNYGMAGRTGYTQTGSVGGSIAFMCRQQLLNYKYSKPEVDVWSAAAVLYFLLAGKPPRDCRSEKNPFNAVLKNNPIPIRNIRPSVPEKLADIIDRALDDSGSLFYKKASDLKHDIVSLLQNH